MLESVKVKRIQKQAKYWYWLLFCLTLLIGLLYIVYVAKSQDEEMRDNLIVYARTIEQSIDWQPHANILNTRPKQLKKADLTLLEQQLNSACKANKNCHFIYLLYLETDKGKPQVKFLLDASPQPASEISHLGDIFSEASDALLHGLNNREPLVEGPVTDRWGTWVSAHVPLTITVKTSNFVMLGIDVAASNWHQQVYKKIIAPIIITLFFLMVLAGLIIQSKKREKLLAQLFSSTSALSLLANNDALTGLPNRRLLEDRMAQALKEAAREQNKVAVLFLDLDYFKLVNDTHGHLVGDQLLRDASVRLTELLRAEDTVARVGGDEFVVLLPKLDDLTQLNTTVEKILSELAKPFVIAEHTLQLGVSIGIALFAEHGDNPSRLIKCADDAMYVAKRQGRNCYHVYQPD
jgi:diguanylate cyclase (GGDEF)-like protein